MKYIFLVKLEQICKPDFSAFLNAFIIKTGLSIKTLAKILYWQGGVPFSFYHAEDLPLVKQGAIYKYRCGQFSDKAFIRAMNEQIKLARGCAISNAEFKECWNSMYTVSQENIAQLHEMSGMQAIAAKKEFLLQRFQTEKYIAAENLTLLRENSRHPFLVYIVAHTNPMHFYHIVQQLKKSGIYLDCDSITSFGENTLNLHAELSGKLKVLRTKFASRDGTNPSDINITDLRSSMDRPLLYTIKDLLGIDLSKPEQQYAEIFSANYISKHNYLLALKKLLLETPRYKKLPARRGSLPVALTPPALITLTAAAPAATSVVSRPRVWVISTRVDRLGKPIYELAVPAERLPVAHAAAADMTTSSEVLRFSAKAKEDQTATCAETARASAPILSVFPFVRRVKP